MANAPRRDLPILFWATVGLVVLLPLPLGAVYQWSWGLMACAVGVLLGAWSIRVFLGQQEVAVGLRGIWWLALPFTLTVLWIAFQALPLAPSSWRHPLWTSTAEALQFDVSESISLNPFDSFSGLARLLAYAGIFFIALQYCRRAARARQVLLAVTYSGFVYALYGLAVYLSGSETILIFRKPAYFGDLTGTFVNRNSFATYAGLALLCATGLILVLVTQGNDGRASTRDRLLRFLEVAVGRGWPLLVAWLVLLVALVLSHSRGGFFSSIIGLLVLMLAAASSRAVGRKLIIGFTGLCAVTLAAVLLLGGEGLLMRLLQTSLVLEERPLVYARTMEAIGDAGMFGTGFGTFEEAFRFYRTSDIAGSFNMAHNTYLENALELGPPVAIALYAVLAGFFIACALGVLRRRRDAVYPCVGLAATVLVAIHSAVDFSLQIPAVTATYMLIMGAACAQCWSSRRPADPW
jgi:O-antigen ligase